MTHKVITHTLMGYLMIALVGSALASEATQSHSEILDTASRYLAQNLVPDNPQARIELTPLDHRLKLTRCESPLEAFSPPGGIKVGHTSVGVRCDTPAPWTLYVSADVAIEVPVVVVTRDLSRGEAIQAADLALQVADTSHLLRGYYESTGAVVGETLKRNLRRGQVVTPSMLVVRKTVKRGEQVTILADTGSIQVRMQGKALKQGNPGDLITVMNTHSNKKVEARVVSKGLVRVY
ncbi:MAG: flagellar basal body P-ring formation chaperone FlgA [Candidatus Thiodiazotropha sp.]|jgi:flagellar basal body P-ring formation protein FlgA